MKNILLAFVIGFSLASCAQNENEARPVDDSTYKHLDSLQTAYFASGCFWCVEAIYESVEGVEEAVSGYSGGEIDNPTYASVSSGRTKHAEAVKVYYDSSVVRFETLVEVFFNSHDPSTLNQQGPDKGPQYRSIAFYANDDEKAIIERKIRILKSTKVFTKITTEVIAFEKFHKAEAYHQNYERKHPNNGYIQAVSIPRINSFKATMPEVLKAENHH